MSVPVQGTPQAPFTHVRHPEQVASRSLSRTSVLRRDPGAPSGSRRTGVLLVLFAALVMWVVEVVDAILPANLDEAGIVPRDPEGLPGIALSPFLHGDFAHLAGNTLPFVVLGVTIAVGGAARVLAVTAVVALVGGLGTWLTSAPGTVTIGASGIVFGYATYLIARGLFSRRLAQIALGVVVALVLGGTLLSGLAPQAGVSWQAHLFGAIGGLVAARWLATRDRRRAERLPRPGAADGFGSPSWAPDAARARR